MKYCKYCGCKIEDNQRFCHECGGELVKSEEQEPPTIKQTEEPEHHPLPLTPTQVKVFMPQQEKLTYEEWLAKHPEQKKKLTQATLLQIFLDFPLLIPEAILLITFFSQNPRYMSNSTKEIYIIWLVILGVAEFILFIIANTVALHMRRCVKAAYLEYKSDFEKRERDFQE